MGPKCVRCHKETAQSLLPPAIRLMCASKARWTIVENVDKIETRDSRGFLKDINNQQLRLDSPTIMFVVSHTLTANGPCPDEQ
jgi:hypothetical protein